MQITLPSVPVSQLSQKMSQWFWSQPSELSGEQPSLLQSYLNFLLVLADPRWNQLRIAADVISKSQPVMNTTLLWLKPATHWKGFKAGQYVELEIELNGQRLKRCYSIASSPAYYEATGEIALGIKAVEQGKVSNAILDSHFQPALVHISQAKGEFVLAENSNEPKDGINSLVFLAAGSGITPIKAMLDDLFNQSFSRHLKQPPTQFESLLVAPQIILVYSGEGREQSLFLEELEAYQRDYHNFELVFHNSAESGFLNADGLEVLLKDKLNSCAVMSDAYLCGPQGFMDTVRDGLNRFHIAPEHIHSEQFVAVRPNAVEGDEVQAHFPIQDVVITARKDQSLLEVAEQAGLNPKYGCRTGICHECKCKRPQGKLINGNTGQEVPEDQRDIQPCITFAQSDVVLELK